MKEIVRQVVLQFLAEFVFQKIADELDRLAKHASVGGIGNKSMVFNSITAATEVPENRDVLIWHVQANLLEPA
ncbi:MAG: hypothetical protein A3H97_20235 [Acidobacteria bacterium RIFCSPLOWO2_02_FULL_65_29]|nr:MAG: hypothetical protein A3H97_20235 [Acidobacteria bacterium RIFCSPLOWO2_02_FULL_65_29]